MRSLLVKYAQATMRYHDLPGNGVPVMFIHGLGCASSCDFPRIAADPELAGRRMLLVDLLGSGFSDRPDNFGYAVDDHARSLCELIDTLQVATVDVVGHSMGGSIAIVLAAWNRAKIRRLVVSEPNLDPGGGSFSKPIAEQNESDYVLRGHDRAVERARAEGNSIWAGSLMTSSPLAVHRGALSLVRGSSPSWRELLRELQMPRTVLFGGRSLPDPDAERLPRFGIAVRVVEDAGHSMIWENPSGYARAVRESLEG